MVKEIYTSMAGRLPAIIASSLVTLGVATEHAEPFALGIVWLPVVAWEIYAAAKRKWEAGK